MTEENYSTHGERLEAMYMTAIDEALDALDAYHAAHVEGRTRDATRERERAKRAWAAFGEIIINRADHRTAHMLLEQLRQVDQMMHPESGEAEATP